MLMQVARADQVGSAADLRAAYASMQEALRDSPFHQALILKSMAAPGRLTGDVYSVVPYAYDIVRDNLDSPEHWCDVMILHLNIKYCHASGSKKDAVLLINIGKKTPETLAEAPRIHFTYMAEALTADYLQVHLHAAKGPLGTSDYRIALEAISLPGNQTFLHMSYSYSMGFSARLATQVYLSTLAHDKVGFTVTGTATNGAPIYVTGMRGMMERNTMRYYLAINACLEVAGAQSNERAQQRFLNWFNATERYARQLHELERNDYLSMKRDEYARQQVFQ
jgi:hypothetical protein